MTGVGTQSRTTQGTLLVILAVPALILLRLAVGGFSFDQVWAEDGAVFLREAREHGLASVLYTYGGYAHVLPRLLALPGAALPLEMYDVYTLVVSVAVVAVLAAFMFRACLHLMAPAAALVPALGMAVVPAASKEAIANIANLQWWLLPAAFVALAVATSGSQRLRVAATAVVLVAALSTPLVLLVTPALLVPGRRGLWSGPALALAGGLLAQAALRVLAPETDLLSVARDPGLHPADAGRFLSGVLGAASQSVAMSVAAGLLVAVGVVAVWWTSRDRRRLFLAAVVSAVAVFAGTSVLSSSSSRYQLTTALLLSIGVAAMAQRASQRAVLGLGAAVALAVLLGFPVQDQRVSGPSWSTTAPAADHSCDDGAERSSPLRVGPSGWLSRGFTVACHG